MNKKFATLTLGAGLAAGTVAGLIAVPAISGAQTSTTPPADAAAPTDQGRPDPSTHLSEVLKPLVDAGTIDQSQADAVIAALKADHDANGPRGGKGGPGMDAAAQALGMTADELHTALDGGQTLAQVAESKGVAVQVVIDALVAAEKTHIAQEVTDGKLTQAQADQRLANVDQRVTDMVNNGRPQGGRGHGGPGGHGADGAAPADSTTTTN